MARKSTRLIVSFIGGADLKLLNKPPPGERSPLLRLLLTVNDPDSELHLRSFIPVERTILLVLDDDRPGCDQREKFCRDLKNQLPDYGLSALKINHKRIEMSGPTDLDALFESVWSAIPTSGPDSANEVVFHVTSGSPAMHLTLMLASQSLRLEEARLFETSREQGVRELKPPYALALRKKRERERASYRLKSLADDAHETLQENTVIGDELAAHAYAMLHEVASGRSKSPRVLIKGSTGSGKWHACKQFAKWRERNHKQGHGAPVIWSDPSSCPELPAGATLLVRWLEGWPEPALQRLALLLDERQDLAIAATYRNDHPAATSLDTLISDGLRGAVQIELPPLAARMDVVELAETLASQLGLLSGKVKERLQHELFTDKYPRNLHDLKTLLGTAKAHSRTRHLTRDAYYQARDLCDANDLLNEAWRVIGGMDFGASRYNLEEVIDAIRLGVVSRALAEGRSQAKAGALLGISQQTVSEYRRAKLDTRRWGRLDELSDGSD